MFGQFNTFALLLGHDGHALVQNSILITGSYPIPHREANGQEHDGEKQDKSGLQAHTTRNRLPEPAVQIAKFDDTDSGKGSGITCKIAIREGYAVFIQYF